MSFDANYDLDYYVCEGCGLLVKGVDAKAFLEDNQPNGHVQCTKRGHIGEYYSDGAKAAGKKLTCLPISQLDEEQRIILRIIQYAKSTSAPGGC